MLPIENAISLKILFSAPTAASQVLPPDTIRPLPVGAHDSLFAPPPQSSTRWFSSVVSRLQCTLSLNLINVVVEPTHSSFILESEIWEVTVVVTDVDVGMLLVCVLVRVEVPVRLKDDVAVDVSVVDGEV